jgi:hypothetical protein
MRCFFCFISASVIAADLDDRDAAGQLGEALLELLAVVVRRRLLDLDADLSARSVMSALLAGRRRSSSSPW